MRPTRVVALVIGCLMLLPGIGLLFAGGALGIGYAAGRNDAGYFEAALTDLQHPDRGHHRRDPGPDHRSADPDLVDRHPRHRSAAPGHRPHQRLADFRRNRPRRPGRRLPERRRPRQHHRPRQRRHTGLPHQPRNRAGRRSTRRADLLGRTDIRLRHPRTELAPHQRTVGGRHHERGRIRRHHRRRDRRNTGRIPAPARGDPARSSEYCSPRARWC